MMTLSSITGDVHESQAFLQTPPCQVKLSQRLHIYPRIHSIGSFLSSAQIWFYSIRRRWFVSWQRRHIGAVWAAWTLAHRAAASCPTVRLIADFAFNQHLNRIVWHSHTFLRGWCRVVKCRGGLGVLFIRDKEQRTVVFLRPGRCAVFQVPISKSFTLLGWIPAGKLCYQ